MAEQGKKPMSADKVMAIFALGSVGLVAFALTAPATPFLVAAGVFTGCKGLALSGLDGIGRGLDIIPKLYKQN